MDALEHCDHLLLLLVYLVKPTQVPTCDNLVDLIGQSFPHERQTPSLLYVYVVKFKHVNYVAWNHCGLRVLRSVNNYYLIGFDFFRMFAKSLDNLSGAHGPPFLITILVHSN